MKLRKKYTYLRIRIVKWELMRQVEDQCLDRWYMAAAFGQKIKKSTLKRNMALQIQSS